MKVRLLLLALMLVLVCVPFAGGCDCDGEGASYVDTIGAFELYAGHALLKGNLSTMAGAPTVDVWFVVWDPDGVVRYTDKQPVTDVGEFSESLDESWLKPGSYKFSAYAEGGNWDKSSSGEKLPFTIPR
jgi:hypothetical protein